MSKEQLCKYTGRSERTIQRWESSPPEYVVHIIELYSKKPIMPDDWKGWYFEDDAIFDPEGNGYGLDEIRSIYFNRQLCDTLVGNQLQVSSMKLELKKRIDAYSGKLNISIGDSETTTIDIWRMVNNT